MTLSTLPLKGYAPDLDPREPGVFSYCFGMESSVRGWKLQRALSTGVTGATQDPSDGLISYTSVGTEIGHVAFGTAIYYMNGGLFQSVGTSYTAGDNFVFCQYGDYTLLARSNASTVRKVQIRDGTTTNSFADSSATGIPSGGAGIVVTWGPPTSPRVMLLNYNDGTAYPDGWWTSHQGGPTLAWTPDIATGAANGRLLGAGIIRCGVAYQDDIIAFGDRDMWRGTFIGPPFVVQWQKISDRHGAIGPYAAKVVNGILYFLGLQGLFQYDGTYPRKMEVPIQQQIINSWPYPPAGGSYMRSKLAADGQGQRLLVSIRADGTSFAPVVATRVYLINLLNNAVGVDGRASWLLLDNKYFATTDKIQQETASVRTTSLGDLFGIGLNYIGENKGDTKITRVIPRFATAPNTFSCTDYFGPTASEVLSNNLAAGTVSATPWRSDFLKSARWHAPRLLFSSSGADVELLDVVVDAVPAGNA